MRGVIDRIDILEDEIRIVDYKSKKMNSKIDKKKLEEMEALKDMQLALYILFARRQYGEKKVESYLQTFKSKYEHAEFAKTATFEVAKEGDFHYDDSDEDQCKWCEFSLMCNTRVIVKEV